jgi:hypothetical protein
MVLTSIQEVLADHLPQIIITHSQLVVVGIPILPAQLVEIMVMQDQQLLELVDTLILWTHLVHRERTEIFLHTLHYSTL